MFLIVFMFSFKKSRKGSGIFVVVSFQLFKMYVQEFLAGSWKPALGVICGICGETVKMLSLILPSAGSEYFLCLKMCCGYVDFVPILFNFK